MIHTLTVNPALDLTYRVPALGFDDTTRASHVYRDAGGKGINVSRVAARLDHPTVAMGFAGGRAGEEIVALLEHEGVRTWFTTQQSSTRTNSIIQDDAGKQLRVSAPGEMATRQELDTLVASLWDLRQPDFLVLSGSLLKGMPQDFYASLIAEAKQQNIKVAVDSDGDELKRAVAAGAYLIKPNQYELGRLVGRDINSIEDAINAAHDAFALGVGVVVASLGAQGALLISHEAAYHGAAPKVTVDSPLGSGDSLLAGVLVALAEARPLEQVLRLGIACGSATAMTPGTRLCYREDIPKLYEQVSITALA